MKTVKRWNGLVLAIALLALNALVTVRLIGLSYGPFRWAAFALVYEPTPPDPAMFDPTGCFYEISNGAVIPGGLVTVNGPGTVTTFLNGSNGCYQFSASNSGTYTLAITLPPGCVLAPGCPDLGTFNPSGLVQLGPPPDDRNNPTMLTPFTGCTNWYTTIVLDDEVGNGVEGDNVPLSCHVAPAPALSWRGLVAVLAGLLALGIFGLRRRPRSLASS